ncbi:LIM and senescent cell antigen-like-containing domain protein 1 isoform X3 [Lineus longissimus]|uniref:LIM and senescent cell antigen-like-containing domain protein 1 isoform X3 n=1 Tax=Lineus longissimus TaxID=88925 RepID=UPI00315D11AA
MASVRQKLRLQPLNASPLFRRRMDHNEQKMVDSEGLLMPPAMTSTPVPNHNHDYDGILARGITNMSLGNAVCTRCQEGFSAHEKIVNSNGEIWHTQCFVCAQCFRPFPEGIFYEFEGRKYCEHDFHVLFAPCCGKCREFIVGRVIKAMNNNWHPDCFRCELCTGPLADAGFVKNAGRALCRECNAKEKASGTGKYVCHKCHAIIEEGHLKFKGEVYHPYHFNCTSCGIELNSDAREKNLELYCLRCHDKMGIPICGACRRPIEERVVHALGKAWHVEHFVCAKCEKPFLGHRHYEKKGLAYCETHYHQLFGNICFVCNTVITGDVFSALNKAWCVNHFACAFCDKKMSQKKKDWFGSGGEMKRTKFYDYDLRPVCKFCYDKFPSELKKRLKKAYEEQPRK